MKRSARWSVQDDSNVTAPSSLVSTLDPTVERVILRCLEGDPTDRPPSALAVAAGQIAVPPTSHHAVHHDVTLGEEQRDVAEPCRPGAEAHANPPMSVEVPLTQRESEVLRQLAYGLTNKEIAQALHINYRAQAATDQALDFLRATTLLAARRFARPARMGCAR